MLKIKCCFFGCASILPLGVSPVIGFHNKKIMKCSAQIPSQEVPASLPTYCWVLLSSVMAVDFPGHVFIRSRTSSGLRCLAEKDGAAVSQFPFIPPIYASLSIPSPLHQLYTSPPPTRQPSARPHTSVPSTDVMGSTFVEVKPTVAVRRLHTPVSKQVNFTILSTPHSPEVCWCSQHPAAAQGLSTRAETLAWDLLLVIRHFLICTRSIRSFVITQLTTPDEKLKTDSENTILKNQRKSKVIPYPRNSLQTRIYTDWITVGRMRNTTTLESLRKNY